MTGCPSQVADLSIHQTGTLKSLVRDKLHELDSFADESLTEYVMVLLANRHGMAKVISDLEDFLSPMVVEDFVQWLFEKCKELKSTKDERRVLDKKSRIFENAWKVVSTTNESGIDDKRGLGMGARTNERMDEGTSERMSERVGRRTDGRTGGRINERIGERVNERIGERVNERMSERISQSIADKISERTNERVSERMSERISKSITERRDARNMIETFRRARSPDSRRRNSRSPESKRQTSPRRQLPRVIKYESISSRLNKGTFCEDDDVIDARDLLSGRRGGRDVSDRRDDHDRRGRDYGYRDDDNRVRDYSRRDYGRWNDDKHEAQSKRSVKLVQDESQMASLEDNSLVRCTYWPNCKAGDDCLYAHPSEPCKHFPNCAFGEKCIYIHPVIPCKFQDRCQNPHCNYQHQSPAGLVGGSFMTLNNPYQPPSAIPCRFFPNCKNSNCPFVHPNTAVCKFAETCQRPACPFVHPNGRVLASKSFVNAPCRYGKNCTKLDCPFQHVASPTADTAGVAEMSTA
ncbi:hypothetical protein PSACC_02291 [Paramicrosporidium saccamoebae]|uniref:Zinc finger CCCH domain-containing protein 14 n=1 Tax=Paramicrosporidium saccamoebae TaxID=1246581 RepID=A0A2H9TJP7_9FUNG|nr:hypothetical protein PSACC_02291 [Paramicrosporidium saccamoebae]